MSDSSIRTHNVLACLFYGRFLALPLLDMGKRVYTFAYACSQGTYLNQRIWSQENVTDPKLSMERENLDWD